MALPPTSHISQFGLEETYARPSCDEQPAVTCFQQPPPVFRYQHFWSNQGVWKKYRVYQHFPPGQCVSKCFPKLAGNHSRPTDADCWPVITQLSLPLTPLLLLHLSARVFIHHLHSVDANTFGSTKAFGKNRVYLDFRQVNAFQTVFKAWRGPFQTHRC